MIIWIASYPKSGNTWVRSLLSSYLYSKDGSFNFELLKNIDQFPSKNYFNTFLKDFSNIKTVSNYWIAAQDRINLLNDRPVFLKTHSALCRFENNDFTNKFNTKAVIHIVRDPRNVVTSLAHHNSTNTEDAYKFMITKEMLLSHQQWAFGISTILGSWSEHYLSWKRIKFAPRIIIKYEDLINDTKNSFIKILKFLNQTMNIPIDEKKVLNTINSCSFDSLSRKEIEEGFFEQVLSKHDNKKLKFFNLGKKNNWKFLLDPKIEKGIREAFLEEMRELNYI